jgi:hypothetical protein
MTIGVESAIAGGFCLWRSKPLRPILFTSFCGNLITQSILWLVLSLFFQHYLAALLMTEILIWILEGLLLHGIALNRLDLTEALFLSLVMNAASFAAGWFLPL